jgi:hypothetical protein
MRQSGNAWKIDVLRSPVVELSRCYFNGSILRVGRFYCDTGFYDERGEWIDKKRAFLEFVSRLFVVAKRTLHRDKAVDAYLGDEALALLQAKRIELRRF